MNVFLPYERDIKKSVQSLDDKRLNKQILECYQLLTTYIKREINGIKDKGAGYFNHPVYKHFISTSYNLHALMKYSIEACIEYKYRMGIDHKLYQPLNRLKINLFKYPDSIDCLYQPYFMRGSLGQLEYVRTYENVSQLFKDRLVEKWSNDKIKPKWTNREIPEFYEV